MSRTRVDGQLKALEAARDKARAKYGQKHVSLGNERWKEDVTPSPSWMLDYKMGTGGFKDGYAVEVFGANSLGKTSVMGYTTLANVQKRGKLPALIAVEPIFDIEWAARFLDVERLMIYRPDNAEEAFDMLADCVKDNLVDFILLDSIGAMSPESELGSDGKDGKRKAFGVSPIVTTGLNRIMPRLWKNQQGLMVLNQQRQDTKSRSQPGAGIQYDSPGGEALHHNMAIRLHLKPGRTRYTVPMGSGKDRETEVLVGRELVCTFKKNKLGMNPKAARFDFFHIPTEKHGFGLDRIEDIIRTCKVAGVIGGGSNVWLEHPSFPKGKVNGKPAFAKLLAAQPEIEDVLRQEVLAKMREEQARLRKQADQGVVAEDHEPDPDEDETEETTDE